MIKNPLIAFLYLAKKRLFFGVILGLSAAGMCGTAYSFVTPEIYFRNLTVSQKQFVAGAPVSGSAELWNNEPGQASDLMLSYTLFYRINGERLLIDRRTGDKFSLFPDETRPVGFTYWLPYVLPGGDFTFRVAVENSRGSVIGWADTNLSLDESGKFVFIGYDSRAGAEAEDPRSQVLIEPLERRSVRFTIAANDFTATSTFPLVYRVSTRDRFGRLLDESSEPLNLANKELRSIEHSLPALAVPGQYETTVSVYNRGSGDAMSNILKFDWIVKGPSGNAKIHYAEADSDSYQSGQTAKISAWLSFPYWPEGKTDPASINAKIYDKNGKLAGEAGQNAGDGLSRASLEVPLTRDADNPRIRIEVRSEDRMLDEYEFAARIGERPNATSSPVIGNPNRIEGGERVMIARIMSYFFLVMIVLAAALPLAGALYYYFKIYRPRKEVRAKVEADLKAEAEKKEGNLGDLLREFDEIDKENKRFKESKRFKS